MRRIREICELSDTLTGDERNTFFFRQLLFKLHGEYDGLSTTPSHESVERPSYFRQLWEHVMQCRERICGTDGCLLSKFVLSHFNKCATITKNLNCEVCKMTRDQIYQGMINHNNNIIALNAKEYDPKRKRKYDSDREDDDQVEDEEEEVKIKKQKHNEDGNDIKEKSDKKLVEENENEEDICMICLQNFEQNNNKIEERKTTSVKNGQNVDENSIVDSFFASCEDKEDNNNIKDNTDKKEKEDNNNKEDDMAVQVECCKKLYHRECLRKWMQRNTGPLTYKLFPKDNTCPTCRKQFKMPRREKDTCSG